MTQCVESIHVTSPPNRKTVLSTDVPWQGLWFFSLFYITFLNVPQRKPFILWQWHSSRWWTAAATGDFKNFKLNVLIFKYKKGRLSTRGHFVPLELKNPDLPFATFLIWYQGCHQILQYKNRPRSDHLIWSYSVPSLQRALSLLIAAVVYRYRGPRGRTEE